MVVNGGEVKQEAGESNGGKETALKHLLFGAVSSRKWC